MANKSIIDKTTSLVDGHLVGNQQYKAGRLGLCKGKVFILLPGKQKCEYFTDDNGRRVPVFKYRAAFVGSDGLITHIDAVNLSDLVKQTYGKCAKNEQGEWLPYPEVGFEFRNNKKFPASFGDELNCGWTIRKEYCGTDSDGKALYDVLVEEPQMFEVIDTELHWVSRFDSVAWTTAQDEKGNVEMRKTLVPIIERKMTISKKLKDQLATL